MRKISTFVNNDSIPEAIFSKTCSSSNSGMDSKLELTEL